MNIIKKKDMFDLLIARLSNCSVSEKFFPMLVETSYFGVVINPKTYLNLSGFAYKLVNILFF